MGKDGKHMKSVRKKRIKSIGKQVGKHKKRIENERGRKDTTKAYWKNEINKKFLPQIKEDE